MPRIGSEGVLQEGAYTADDRRGALQDLKARGLGLRNWNALKGRVEPAKSVGRGRNPERKDNVVKDTHSPTKSSKSRGAPTARN